MSNYAVIPMVAENGAVLNVKVPLSLPSAERVAELEPAFDRVKDPSNWKRPINRVLYFGRDSSKWDAAKALYAEAIDFYTATAASFRAVRAPGWFHVSAPGYYAGPAN
jgi:hypothetical protein